MGFHKTFVTNSKGSRMNQKKQLAVAVAAAILVVGVSHAQSSQKVERVEVTGSNIKRVDSETPAPIQIISRADIERSGAQTVSDLLQKIPSNNGGSFTESNLASFAAGASAVSLRGLGPQATLVLLNGRRVANYGFAVGAQTVFVDLNTIPLEAVDRIEILKDGASAIYGSEAIAGVVNIILRSDFRGAIVKGAAGISSRSDANTYRASLAGGVGDIASQKFNAFGTLEVYKRDPLYTRDRDYTSTQDLRSIGYTDARSANAYPGNFERINGTTPGFTGRIPVPGCSPVVQNVPAATAPNGQCVLDPNNYYSTLPKVERANVFGKIAYAINPNMTLFGEAGYVHTKTKIESTPSAPTTWLRTTDFTLQSISIPNNAAMVLPVGNPSNPYATPVILRYTFVDLGPRTNEVTTDVVRLVGGVKGSFGAWDYESALLYNKSESEALRNGFIRASALRTALADGSYLFGKPNSAAVLANLSPTLKRRGESTTQMADFKISNPDLMALPGGNLGLAAGVEFRRESMKDTPDQLYATGDVVGLGATTADGSRNVSSAYIEATGQLVKNVEAQAAFRFDRYSDYGNSATPKFGIKWTPIKELLLRGTFAKGFRAPALPEIAKSSVAGFFNNQSDPSRCPTTKVAADCNFSIPAVIGPNPNLVPEKADSFTLGAVIEPTKNLSFAVDYYEIKRKNEIGSLDITFLLDNESKFPGLVFRNPAGTDGLPGTVRYVNLQYINTGRTETKGFDFDLRFKVPTDFGTITGNLGVAHIVSYMYGATPPSPLEEYIGTRNQPRNRSTASLGIERGPWSGALGVNHTSGFRYVAAPSSPCPLAATYPSNCNIASWTTLALSTKYTGFKNLELTLNVDNLMDKKAPLDLRYAELYNYFFHNTVGRYFTAGLKYSFR
jgi:iron complex outermembrane recepter protein